MASPLSRRAPGARMASPASAATPHGRPGPQFRHMHGAQEPAGEAGLDFLARLELAEERDRATGPRLPSPPSSPPPQQQQQQAQAPRSVGKRSALRSPDGHHRRSPHEHLSFHPELVTSTWAAVEGADRTVIPCMAFGGVNPYSEQEDKFFGTKMFIKEFRQRASRQDEGVRRMFNKAAAEEAKLRAKQLQESIDVDETPRGSALRSLEEKHYAQHLALMQRANVRYQMQKERWQGGAASAPGAAPTVPTPEEQSHFIRQHADETARPQGASRGAPQRVAAARPPPGGQSTVVLG